MAHVLNLHASEGSPRHFTQPMIALLAAELLMQEGERSSENQEVLEEIVAAKKKLWSCVTA